MAFQSEQKQEQGVEMKIQPFQLSSLEAKRASANKRDGNWGAAAKTITEVAKILEEFVDNPEQNMGLLDLIDAQYPSFSSDLLNDINRSFLPGITNYTSILVSAGEEAKKVAMREVLSQAISVLKLKGLSTQQIAMFLLLYSQGAHSGGWHHDICRSMTMEVRGELFSPSRGIMVQGDGGVIAIEHDVKLDISSMKIVMSFNTATEKFASLEVEYFYLKDGKVIVRVDGKVNFIGKAVDIAKEKECLGLVFHETEGGYTMPLLPANYLALADAGFIVYNGPKDARFYEYVARVEAGLSALDRFCINQFPDEWVNANGSSEELLHRLVVKSVRKELSVEELDKLEQNEEYYARFKKLRSALSDLDLFCISKFSEAWIKASGSSEKLLHTITVESLSKLSVKELAELAQKVEKTMPKISEELKQKIVGALDGNKVLELIQLNRNGRGSTADFRLLQDYFEYRENLFSINNVKLIAELVKWGSVLIKSGSDWILPRLDKMYSKNTNDAVNVAAKIAEAFIVTRNFEGLQYLLTSTQVGSHLLMNMQTGSQESADAAIMSVQEKFKKVFKDFLQSPNSQRLHNDLDAFLRLFNYCEQCWKQGLDVMVQAGFKKEVDTFLELRQRFPNAKDSVADIVDSVVNELNQEVRDAVLARLLPENVRAKNSKVKVIVKVDVNNNPVYAKTGTNALKEQVVRLDSLLNPAKRLASLLTTAVGNEDKAKLLNTSIASANDTRQRAVNRLSFFQAPGLVLRNFFSSLWSRITGANTQSSKLQESFKGPAGNKKDDESFTEEAACRGEEKRPITNPAMIKEDNSGFVARIKTMFEKDDGGLLSFGDSTAQINRELPAQPESVMTKATATVIPSADSLVRLTEEADLVIGKAESVNSQANAAGGQIISSATVVSKQQDLSLSQDEARVGLASKDKNDKVIQKGKDESVETLVDGRIGLASHNLRLY